VGFGDTLVALDTDLVAEEAAASAAAAELTSGTLFRSPTSGRYYARPSPEAEPFVSVGDLVTRGQTVALLEVMKTFNRVQYGDPSLPERAKVLRIVPKDEDDLAAGDPILELEPAE
jgi:acetyl-CoA carboxylase biotin carboxyl carrier protein